MGLDQILTDGIATIKEVTADLQVDISHRPLTGFDSYANRQFGTLTTYSVIIQHKERMVKAENGDQRLSKTQIIFLQPLNVTMEDEITLPDNTQPQILMVEGVMNPDGVMYNPMVYF